MRLFMQADFRLFHALGPDNQQRPLEIGIPRIGDLDHLPVHTFDHPKCAPFLSSSVWAARLFFIHLHGMGKGDTTLCKN